MRPHRGHRLLAAALAASAGMAVSVFAQEGTNAAAAPGTPAPATPPPAPPPAEPTAEQPQPAAPQPAAPQAQPPAPAQPVAEPGRIRFNFKDAPFDQVLDFFSRQAGKPIIREAKVPDGGMTFISAESYSFEDALTILNLNLQMHGVRLRAEPEFFFLSNLQDSMRKPGEVVSRVPPDAAPDQVLTLTIPLNNTLAPAVAEQIKPLIGPFGGVQAVPAQNMLIVVETAAQCRRIHEIVQAIDAIRPADSEYRIFHLKHAPAAAVHEALKGLISEKRQTVVIDPKDNNKRTVIQEDQIVGLSIQPDPRTNSIVAVGPKARLDQVGELVALLDVPEGTMAGAQMATFALTAVTPQDAATHLGNLFKAVPDPGKPTIVPLNDAGKVAVVGTGAQVSQAMGLIAEIDPGAARTDASQRNGQVEAVPERRATTIRLAHINAAAVEQMAARLLSPRQVQSVKFVPMSDGKGIVATGPSEDIAAFEKLVAGLDVAPELPREVRQVRLASGDVQAILDRAAALHAGAGHDKTDPLSWTIDAPSRTVTLIGPAAAVEKFAALLRSAEANLVIETESRVFQLAKVKPSVLAGKLARIARPMLQPADGAAYVEPRIEAVDELGTLIVQAQPAQFAVIAQLVKSLDHPEPGSARLTVLPVASGKPSEVRERAMAAYAAQVAQVPGATTPEVTADDSAGALQIVGDPEATVRFTQIVGELQRLAGPARDVRMIELKVARADAVVLFLSDLIKSSESFRAKSGPEPVIEAIEETNTLLVAAQPPHFAILEALARNLDASQTTERMPVRILRLRSTDAANLAAVLQASFDKRPLEQRVRQPVDIQADAATNTLVVSAHPEAVPEIERIVTELNQTKALDEEGREIRIFPLKVARAEEMARTIESMFPEPPIPLDPRTRVPRPDLQRPREVLVRADRGTNALVVDALPQRIAGLEQLVKNLDQQRVTANVEMRTYRVTRAELNSVVATVRSMAASGAIYGGAQPNAATPVTVDVEPITRTMIVTGPGEVFKAVEEVLTRLDAAAARPETGVKMYALKHARVERLQPVVAKVLATRLREQQQRDGSILDPAGLLDVAAEPATNTLVISAPVALQPAAEELIAAFDTEAAQGATEVRVFRLGKGDAKSAAEALRAGLTSRILPGEPQPIVTAEPASNTLVVAAAPARLAEAEALIKSMDQAVEPGGIGVRAIHLKHVRAESIAPVLEGVLRKESVIQHMAPWQVGQYLAAGGQVGDEVRVAAERRINAVVISAPLPILELAAQIVADLDADPGARATSASRPVRIVTLVNADAAELGANLEEVFKADADGAEPPTVRVDKASNSLIIRATDEQMATIEALAQKLDAATLTTSRQMRMIPLDRSRADAAAVAQTLRRLLEQQGGVKVEVINAEDLLKDTPEAPSPKPRGDAGVFAPDGATACSHGWRSPQATGTRGSGSLGPSAPDGAEEPSVARAHSGLYPQLLTILALAAQPADEPGVTIAVDPVTNSLIILGSPRIADRLAALAEMIQRQMPAEPTRVRIVNLPDGADPQAIGQIVQQTVQQIGRAGATNPGGFTGPVVTSPDPGGGALVVWANDTDFESVGQLIGSIAKSEAATSLTVKVYPLASVTSQRAIQAVNDLLDPAPRGAQAQRVRRAVELTIPGPDGAPMRATIDPSRVRMTSSPGGTAIVVAAPAEAIPLIDRFIETMDQSPVTARLAIRRYDLKNAQAKELAQTFQRLFEAQRQGPNPDDLPRAQFVPDDRTNSMLVTASEAQHADVQRLLGTMDQELIDKDLRLEIITLQNASPSTVKNVVEQVVVGRDPAKKDKVQVSADDNSNIFVVRAPAEYIEDIKAIVAQVDMADAPGLPMRTLKLQHADAQSVAVALQRFFQQRADASSRPGRRVQNRVAIIGDRRSGTLVVTASDEDFEQVQSLIGTFDQPVASKELQLRVIQLQHARVPELRDTLENISWQLRSERGDMGFFWFGFGGRQQRAQDEPEEDRLYVDTNERTNSVILLGQGPTLERMEGIVKALDVPVSQLADTIVRAVPTGGADPRAIARAIREATRTAGLPWWQDRDSEAVVVEPDDRRRMVVLIGKRPKVEAAVGYIEELVKATGRPGQQIETISLRHAQADRAAESLRRFFDERAKAAGLPDDQVSVVGSRDGNVVIAAADAESMGILRDLVAQIDQPELGKDRRREVYVLKDRKADEVAQVLRQQFPSREGGGRTDAAVIVTPMPSTNSLIVSAPQEDFAQVETLIRELDTASLGDVKIVTVNLKTARAQEVGDALRGALPPTVNVKVTPLARSNAIMLTGSDESIALAMEQIGKIDAEPERTLMEFRRFTLKHAIASDIDFTLRMMLRARPRSATDPDPAVDYGIADNSISVSGTADQILGIAKMIEALDVPGQAARATEFVKLQFANAEQTAKALDVFYGRFAREATTPGARAVSIVPDPASNSLVISADAAEWEGIRALLKKLDTEDYDTSRQLTVIPLRHADAQSVARALNEGFRAPIEQRVQREQLRQQRTGGGAGGSQRPDDQLFPPAVLVDAEGTPSVSAEPHTNSLIVFSGRRELERIKALVTQIDIPDFNRLPAAHVIPLAAGKASAIAESVRTLYGAQQGGSGARGPGMRSVLIVGDDVANALIVRAEDRELAEIRALTETLQQQGDRARATVRVLTLRNVPAARLQKTITQTFAKSALQLNEVLAVEVDRTSNALVVASSERLFEEIERVVRELDGAVAPGDPAAPPGPGGRGPMGQSVFIIDVQNNSPEQVRKMLEDMGLTKPQDEDRPGVVAEPISIVPLTTRRAIAVVASAADGEAVVALVRALDAAPAEADQFVAVVALRLANAPAIVNTLKAMLKPGEQDSQTSPASALAEQVRRLNVARNGLDKADLVLDLSKPIRLIADGQTNSVIVGSTKENVAALREVVKTLDSLPIGEAVVVRIFPLTNASATRAKTVIDELFAQGEALRRIPGTQRQGLPTTATGKALAGAIALSVDDRTNTLIVAGREEAVAFVEVVVKDLDSPEASKWVEPTLVPLKFADAARIADTLNQVLVQGLTISPEAIGLQKQFGRLRLVRQGRDMNDPQARIEADLFAPFTGLVIAAEEQLNALIVIGSPANIEVVKELAATLDVEAAAASNTVRIFPLQFAAADRVAALVQGIFRQREGLPGTREEDRLIVAPDVRTNALIVSTSPRSFSILDAILKTLDTKETHQTVGIHVVPVIGADAATIAPKIQALMRERIQAARAQGGVPNPTDAFSIEADKASNLLIVASSDENLEVVKELVAALAAGNPTLEGAKRTDIVQLKTGRVSDLAEAVDELYVKKEQAKRGADAVTVVPNNRLNALVITGTEQDVSAIRRLVERLDTAEVTSVQNIRFIELKSANALEVVNLLQNVFTGRSVGGAGGIGARQATRLRFMREMVAGEIQDQTGVKPTEAQVDAAIREQMTLTPDLRTNRVVASAPPEMMALIVEMIEDLDSTKRDRRIEKYELKNADARDMAELLRDVFNLRQQGSLYVLMPTAAVEPGTPEADKPQAPDQRFTPVPDERQQLSIAIDARTNTLIVSGTEEYLVEVGKLVSELDGIQAAERERLVYRLKNAKAKEVEATLAASFKQETDLQPSILGEELSGAVLRQLEQEVTVVGDEKSNRLIVTVSPRYTEKVMELIGELDSAPPQVVIQVLLAEVTVDNSENWAVDMKLNNLGGDDFNFVSLAAGAGVATALGVPNLAFSSVDFDLLVRALEAQGKLQVLSRPSVTVNNNEKASIQVGDDIAIVTGVERSGDTGRSTADVERRELGIILNVTPTISDDGFVRMDLAPEISTLSQRTTQIDENFQAPVITQRKMSTTVTVKDGQTVVIGGLIQSTEEERKTKVPFLGDVPIIGGLFRSTDARDVKTELVVILTPRVIYNDTPEGPRRLRDLTERRIDSLEHSRVIRDALRQDGANGAPVPEQPPGDGAPPADAPATPPPP